MGKLRRVFLLLGVSVSIIAGCTVGSSPKVETNQFGDFTVSIDSVAPQKKRGVAGYAINYTVTFTGTRSATTHDFPFLEDSKKGVGGNLGFFTDAEPIRSGDTDNGYLFTSLDLSLGEHDFYVEGPDDTTGNAELLGIITLGPENLD